VEGMTDNRRDSAKARGRGSVRRDGETEVMRTFVEDAIQEVIEHLISLLFDQILPVLIFIHVLLSLLCGDPLLNQMLIRLTLSLVIQIQPRLAWEEMDPFR
jgi:DNA integrity scanning protein DisA with diadenylate cyclase activity